MGNIKTSYVKRMGKLLLEKYPEKFGNDFSENKKALKELLDISSKNLRNVIAGYITNLKGQGK